MYRTILTFIAILASLGLPACSEQDSRQQAEFLVFGTVMEVTTWGSDKSTSQQAFAQLQGMFQEMHGDWHAWNPGLLTNINQAFANSETIEASAGIVEMVRRSQELETLSGGRFNPAIGGLIRLWGFHTSIYPIEGPPPSAPMHGVHPSAAVPSPVAAARRPAARPHQAGQRAIEPGRIPPRHSRHS